MKGEDRIRTITTLSRRDGSGCFYCREPLAIEQVTLDHYIPRAAGGTWDIANLRLSCQPCNNRKSNIVPDGSRHPVPAPRKKKKTREERAAIKQKKEICPGCMNGRMLYPGSTCPICQHVSLPQSQSHLYKRRADSCDHSTNWCMFCAILTEDERLEKALSLL